MVRTIFHKRGGDTIGDGRVGKRRREEEWNVLRGDGEDRGRGRGGDG